MIFYLNHKIFNLVIKQNKIIKKIFLNIYSTISFPDTFDDPVLNPTLQ